MKISNLFTCFICATVFVACSKEKIKQTITITNTLNIDRSFETIELTKELLKVEDLSIIGIKDVENGELQIIQIVDNNGNGDIDELLFQPAIGASSVKQYEIIAVSAGENPKANNYCYSRFVPERTDDYAWENDKVAFRVFGPTAQKMVEENVKGGTLTSGVDVWLKKVDYPIINKWYKKTTEGTGSYHEDTGEGVDNFHVGVSRGVGGVAVKMNESYHFSKNYTEWRTITTGPIRTSFYLNYEDWDAEGNKIIESKIVSLDLGAHFSKFKISIEGIDQISAGLTLHEKDGEITGNNEKGWVSYWQPHGDSQLGTAIIAGSKTFVDFENYNVEAKDLSNAYAHLKVSNNTVVYYAGFGWKESGQFKNQQEWENYLNAFSTKINNPLVISYN